MTEREKLLSGLEYNSRDEELIALYHRARALTKSLEALDSHQADEKNRLLGELFGSWGEASWIETPFWCDYGQHRHRRHSGQCAGAGAAVPGYPRVGIGR
ncbi:Maltose O-acetyltransferase [Serratia marcescens]|uniref:maltose acetyltransferase domain-containing protein n=1 Tax=Serratia marcescens TaxID=615 RepID=UPI0007453600|nr:maltose acetyltransferase domain-containing protein [Serratia marcescens]CUZ44344.1 Maltose O-acetyltransferase [Serratia marcescens]